MAFGREKFREVRQFLGPRKGRWIVKRFGMEEK
jgi:hypothetical protein